MTKHSDVGSAGTTQVIRPWGDEVRSTRTQPRIAYWDLAPTGVAAETLPAVLLHGVGSSSETWGELVPALPARRLILPDYRGHGRSESPPGPYSLDDFVSDLRRVLDELGIGRCDIVGFSIGALVGQHAALVMPERVRSLVMLSAIGGRTAAESERSSARLRTISRTPPDEIARASVARWFTKDFATAHPDLVEKEVSIVSASDPAGYRASYEVLASNDLIDEVSGIGCPTLIMTGEFDEGSTPRMSRLLHERIAGSQLFIIPNRKHYIHVECPAEVAGLIGSFWDAVARS